MRIGRCSFVLLLSLTVLSKTNALVNVYTYHGLWTITDLPTDIPTTVTHIYISDQDIGQVDTIVPYPNLQLLSIFSNKLTQIPVLDNVRATLETLRLGYNEITTVDSDRLEVLTNLAELSLTGNPLVGFTKTHFAMPSLWKLQLSRVQVDEFPPELDCLCNVTYLRFEENTFTIQPISDLHVLQTLYLGGEYGGYFPDLVNVSSTLQVLSIQNSNITHIPTHLLSQMIALRVLYMIGNPLLLFPDVPGLLLTALSLRGSRLNIFPRLTNMGHSIQFLDVSGSDQPFTVITDSDLSVLTRLTDLELDYLNLAVIPDFTRVNSSELRVSMSGTTLDCGKMAIMLKISAYTRQISLSGAQTCASPEQLQGKSLANLSPPEMATETVVESRKKWTVVKRIPELATFYAYPRVSKILPFKYPSYCANLCFSTGCVMFAKNETHCVMTDMSPGSESEFRSYSEWYIIQ